MKKTRLLNAELSQCIASLGHTDSLTICDAGLPIPSSANRIDLALTQGIPSFMETLTTISDELFIEKVVVATEIETKNRDTYQEIKSFIYSLEKKQGNNIDIQFVSHESFKKFTHFSKGIVRTGECRPYANIILYSGVPF